jgi:hypothetical protein
MRCAVNRLSTSVVREIRTLRSVGAGSRSRVPGDPVLWLKRRGLLSFLQCIAGCA